MPQISIIAYQNTLNHIAQYPSVPFHFVFDNLANGIPLKHHQWAIPWAQITLEVLREYQRMY